MEIERKFLIKTLDSINLSELENKHIIQNYLYVDEFTCIRKRFITYKNNNKYCYTIKTRKQGFCVNEIETETLSSDEYYRLNNNKLFNEISKTRYLLPYKDYLIEIDVFDGIFKGIIFAEVEFKSEAEAFEFDKYIPDWFGVEISNYITNSDMAVLPIHEVFEKLKNIEE